MKKLNLGCGEQYLKGYINADNNKQVKTDIVVDLNVFPYPFKKNYADEILLDNVLEHLDNIPKIMQELHRITKPTGKIVILVPYGKSDGALQDPTHKHFFTEKSMDYFSEDFPYHYYVNFSFMILEKTLYNANKTRLSKLRYIIPGKPILRFLLWNMYDGIRFVLRPVK